MRFLAAPPEAPPPPDRSAEEIRDAADDILSRPEFMQEESLYDRILGWIGDRLNEVLSALTGGGRGAFIAWALLLLAAAALAYLIWRVVRGGPAAAAGRGRPGAVVVLDDVRRSASEWRSEAEAHARAGRWRDALRCRWRALVADLAERDRIQDAPGLTAGEYRGLVATHAPLASPSFGEATDLFEHAWYGASEVGPDDLDRMVAMAEQALAAGAPTGAGTGGGGT